MSTQDKSAPRHRHPGCIADGSQPHVSLLAPPRCAAWVNKPAIYFHLPNHQNLFHYLNDALLRVLDTLNDTGLTPPGVQR